MRKLIGFLACGVGLFFIIVFIGANSNQSTNENHTADTQKVEPRNPAQERADLAEVMARNAEIAARRNELIRKSDGQVQFLQAVNNARSGFHAAGTDEFAQGATRPTRRAAICATELGRSVVVREWIGRVHGRTTNGDGKGVLSVDLGNVIPIKTWNNSLSDIGDRTLVEPGSPVYLAMGSLRQGDWVRVSGNFVRSDVDCVREASVTIRGSMATPEFIFRFESIRKVELP